MKNESRMLLTVLLVLLTGINQLAAQSKKIDGIKYKAITPDKVEIEEGRDVQGELRIPATVTIGKNTYQVASIGQSAFEGCNGLQSLVLPEGLEQINLWAFKNCQSLQSVTFPSQMKSIGVAAFSNCTALKDINLNRVESIHNAAFEGCNKLTATLRGTRQIGDQAFTGCHKVIYYLPELEKLPDHPTQKMDYSIQSSLKKAGLCLSNDALYACKEVELYFPETVKRIGNNIFSQAAAQGCLYIHLPASLQEIGENAFRKSGLTELVLPAGVSVGESAFRECSKLKTVKTLPSATGQSANVNPAEIGAWAFQYCNQLESAELPAGITTIGKAAFSNCPLLRSIQAQGVTTVQANAFSFCQALQTVRFSSSLKELGNDAFWSCNSLKSLQGVNPNTYLGTNVFFGSGINPEQLKKSFSYKHYSQVYWKLLNWRKKGEFETTAQWRARVTPEAQQAKAEQLIREAEEAYLAPYRNAQTTGLLGTYNADQGLYSVTLNADGEIMNKQYIAVSLADAPAVKAGWNQAVITPVWSVYNDRAYASSFTVEINGKTYRSQSNVTVAAADNLALNMPMPELDFGTDTPPANIGNRTTAAAVQPAAPATDTRLDTDIPVTGKSSPNTFAVIIGNENYLHVARVPHALNDAKIFAAYCRKTLGLPQQNIRSYQNATFGTMLAALADLKRIAEAYEGNIQVLFYYAGHGIPNETGTSSYLLPVDANGTQTEACLPLDRLYRELGNLKARSVIVFMDACFSGTQRGDGMLVSARGIAIKAKAGHPTGQTVVFSAAQGDETAFPYNEKGHGLFTYYLLEKIRETRGEITLGELAEYVATQVKRQSVVINRKSQTPTVTASLQMSDEAWKSLPLH